MIYSLIKRAVFLIALICIPLVHSGCSSQATPTLLEVPTPISLKFISPDRLKIDFGTIEFSQQKSIIVQKFVGDGPFGEVVAAGPETVDIVEGTGIDFLKGIEQLEVDINPNITTFEADFEFNEASDLLSGSHNIKILFDPLDFDNDGALEPCSGNTAALPVCAFIWLDNERLAAWIIEGYAFDDDPATPENEDTIGKGRFKVFREEGTGSTAFTVFYEQTSESEKTIEHFLTAQITLNEKEMEAESHIKIAESLLDSSILKRIDANLTLSVPADDFTVNSQYLGQFLEGTDLWSGSFDGEFLTSGGTEPVQFVNQCVRISTGELADDPNACDDRGISVGDDPFIRAFLPSDVSVPNEFQATPPSPPF
jgi:hypothetical protein